MWAIAAVGRAAVGCLPPSLILTLLPFEATALLCSTKYVPSRPLEPGLL